MPQSPIALDDYGRASRERPPIAARLVEEQGDVIRDRFLFEPAVPYKAFYGSRVDS
jgi:uncharacterized protein